MLKCFFLILMCSYLYQCHPSDNLYEKYNMNAIFNTEPAVVDLIRNIINTYLKDCIPFILYDDLFYQVLPYKLVLEKLLLEMPHSFSHGHLRDFVWRSAHGKNRHFCNHFILLATNATAAITTLGFVPHSKVVVISTMSLWKVKEFLKSALARKIYNLLLIADPTLQTEHFIDKPSSLDINMYTHELHVDGIGNSLPKVLTSWRNKTLARLYVNLFPAKLQRGFNGHKFTISAAEQPPFVFKKHKQAPSGDNWDGIEVRTLRILADVFNMTLVIRNAEYSKDNYSVGNVIYDVAYGKADMGISGIYIDRKFYNTVHFSIPHSQDCASFITLTSTAIPKYRAILGPFKWTIWICIVLIYLFGAIPIRFSQRLSIKKTFYNLSDVGRSFWIVFGTFTNCFSFKGESSWNNVQSLSSRILVGAYWILTIIITAAYSSSIISFITTSTYFEVVNTVQDLLEESYSIGTLGVHEWKWWFNDTVDSSTNSLMQHAEVLPDIDVAIENVVRKKRYAFLGSKEQQKFFVLNNYVPRTAITRECGYIFLLELPKKTFIKISVCPVYYIPVCAYQMSPSSALLVKFTQITDPQFTRETGGKKSKYHILDECLAQFMVSLVMKPDTEFLTKFNEMLMRLQQNGLLLKLKRDIEWDMIRSGGIRLMTATSNSLKYTTAEDRRLTLDDVQGIFLLLAVGIAMALVSVVYECCSGYNFFQRITEDLSRIPSIILTTPSDDFDKVDEKRSTFILRSISATTNSAKKFLISASSKIRVSSC